MCEGTGPENQGSTAEEKSGEKKSLIGMEVIFSFWGGGGGGGGRGEGR